MFLARSLVYGLLLPEKLKALLNRLPESVKLLPTMCGHFYKDTIAANKLIQSWRAPTNRIQTLKAAASTRVDFVVLPYADKGTPELTEMYRRNATFAAYFPVSLLNEVPRRLDGPINQAALGRLHASAITYSLITMLVCSYMLPTIRELLIK